MIRDIRAFSPDAEMPVVPGTILSTTSTLLERRNWCPAVEFPT
jgi:hypothetical protein